MEQRQGQGHPHAVSESLPEVGTRESATGTTATCRFRSGNGRSTLPSPCWPTRDQGPPAVARKDPATAPGETLRAEVPQAALLLESGIPPAARTRGFRVARPSRIVAQPVGWQRAWRCVSTGKSRNPMQEVRHDARETVRAARECVAGLHADGPGRHPGVEGMAFDEHGDARKATVGLFRPRDGKPGVPEIPRASAGVRAARWRGRAFKVAEAGDRSDEAGFPTRRSLPSATWFGVSRKRVHRHRPSGSPAGGKREPKSGRTARAHASIGPGRPRSPRRDRRRARQGVRRSEHARRDIELACRALTGTEREDRAMGAHRLRARIARFPASRRSARPDPGGCRSSRDCAPDRRVASRGNPKSAYPGRCATSGPGPVPRTPGPGTCPGDPPAMGPSLPSPLSGAGPAGHGGLAAQAAQLPGTPVEPDGAAEERAGTRRALAQPPVQAGVVE